MKTKKSLLLALALLGYCTATLHAKSLKVRIVNLRSDRGAVLYVAMKGDITKGVKSDARPLYGRAVPERGAVEFSFDAIEADSLTVSILHDENGNFRLDREEGRPAEGCLHLAIALPDEENSAELELRYDFAATEAEESK